ncbi:membrane hypothetical protein [uncultured Thiomicrorhabdus sp.]
MSSKVNIIEIISGNYKTLTNTEGQILKSDIVVFVLLPIILSITGIIFGFNLNKDLASLLVNFGAIFTALLLSVLVLVYDQEAKLNEKKNQSPTNQIIILKIKLLQELYYNISFSILLALGLILLCFIHNVVTGLSHQLDIYSIHINFKYSIHSNTHDYIRNIYSPHII